MSGLSRSAPFLRVVSPCAPRLAVRAAACAVFAAVCALGVAGLAGCSLVPENKRGRIPLRQVCYRLVRA